MTANLLRAFNNGRVKVTNVTHGEAIVYFPGAQRTESRIFRAGETLVLSDEVPIHLLKKSPNLARLVEAGTLRVEL